MVSDRQNKSKIEIGSLRFYVQTTLPVGRQEKKNLHPTLELAAADSIHLVLGNWTLPPRMATCCLCHEFSSSRPVGLRKLHATFPHSCRSDLTLATIKHNIRIWRVVEVGGEKVLTFTHCHDILQINIRPSTKKPIVPFTYNHRKTRKLLKSSRAFLSISRRLVINDDMLIARWSWWEIAMLVRRELSTWQPDALGRRNSWISPTSNLVLQQTREKM